MLLYPIKTIHAGMTAGMHGGRMNTKTLENARPLDARSVAHILGYTGTQSAAAQVWACGVGRKGLTLFVIVPVEDIRRAAQSGYASMIWDDVEENAAKSRNIDADAPRVLAHGMATAMAALTRCGCKTNRYVTGVAGVRYSDIPKGDNGTRSDALERMVTQWVTTFEDVERCTWTGRLNGGGYDYTERQGRQAAAHYNADVAVKYVGGDAMNLEVKGHYGRAICPISARQEYGLE